MKWRLFPRSLRQLVLMAFLLVLLPLLVLAWQAWESLSALSNQAADTNRNTFTDVRRSEAMARTALELERSGDHVKRIAKELGRIPGDLPTEVRGRLSWIGNQARGILQRALDAYARADATQAPQAWADDAELDRFYKEFLSDLLARMRGETGWVDIGVRLISIAKSLERIADHATNVAEEARFVASGELGAAHRGEP